MKPIFNTVLERLESLAATTTTCDGCGEVIGERYPRWPSHTLELATDPKQRGKIKAKMPEPVKPGEPETLKAEEYIPRKEFHFCCEDCVRNHLNKRNE